MVLLNYVAFFAFLIRTVRSSVGDFSLVYRHCTNECRDFYSCPQQFDRCPWTTGFCFRCRYDCMWKTVDSFVEQHGYVPQFHGKWPFVAIELPFLGLFDITIQEPASFLFSLLNLYTLVLFYRQVKRMIELKTRKIWMLYALIGMATWVCSAIFHACDCWITEYLDYFSAFAFILSASYVSYCFAMPWISVTLSQTRINIVFGFLLVIWYFRHVYSMTQHFDYEYNMFCCMGVSLFTTMMYLFYILIRRRLVGRFTMSDRLLLLILFWTNGSVLFETFDFAPIFWTFDAHSLFHAATIPLPLFTRIFLREYVSENIFQLDKTV